MGLVFVALQKTYCKIIMTDCCDLKQNINLFRIPYLFLVRRG